MAKWASFRQVTSRFSEVQVACFGFTFCCFSLSILLSLSLFAICLFFMYTSVEITNDKEFEKKKKKKKRKEKSHELTPNQFCQRHDGHCGDCQESVAGSVDPDILLSLNLQVCGYRQRCVFLEFVPVRREKGRAGAIQKSKKRKFDPQHTKKKEKKKRREK